MKAFFLKMERLSLLSNKQKKLKKPFIIYLPNKYFKLSPKGLKKHSENTTHGKINNYIFPLSTYR